MRSMNTRMKVQCRLRCRLPRGWLQRSGMQFECNCCAAGRSNRLRDFFTSVYWDPLSLLLLCSCLRRGGPGIILREKLLQGFLAFFNHTLPGHARDILLHDPCILPFPAHPSPSSISTRLLRAYRSPVRIDSNPRTCTTTTTRNQRHSCARWISTL